MEHVLSLLVQAASVAALLAVALFLLSSHFRNLVRALTAKAAGEGHAKVIEAEVATSGLLVAAIHAAMVYAENHEAEVLHEFKTKAEYVETTIADEPLFTYLDRSAEHVRHLIEQIWQAYFSSLPHKEKPKDVIGGGGPG